MGETYLRKQFGVHRCMIAQYNRSVNLVLTNVLSVNKHSSDTLLTLSSIFGILCTDSTNREDESGGTLK